MGLVFSVAKIFEIRINHEIEFEIENFLIKTLLEISQIGDL
jgi:hypothetical protein